MKPLTIEELKAMPVGDWVWVTTADGKYGSYGQVCTKFDEDNFRVETIESYMVDAYSDYGTKWLAYKNKEQAEAKGEIGELPCKVGDIIFVPYVYKGVSDIMRLIVDEIQITKYSIVFCTEFDTDDEGFATMFSHGHFLLGNYGDIWFADKVQAEARLKELRGKK